MKYLPITFDGFFKRQNDLFDEFDKLIEIFESPSILEFRGSYPKINIIEKDKEFQIVAAVPGMDKKDIEVFYKDGMLSIKGNNNQEETDCKYICRELKKSQFVRSISINSETTDINKITSTFNNGELRIIIPKKKEILKREEIKKIDII